jgi:hypothetical protein
MQTACRERGFFSLRFLFASALCLTGVFLSVLTFAAHPARETGPTSPRPATPTIPSWSPVTAPNMAATAANTVTCVSTSDCWIVGNFYDGTLTVQRPMTEHWNGAAWSIIPPSVPSTTSNNKGGLEGVACPSSSLCWAVGEFQNNSGVQQPLIERWDGNSWSIVAANTSTTQANYLHAVTCNSVSDCWAIGAINPGSAYQTLILHWNGTSWSVASSPNAPNSTDNSLADVTCLSTTDCWAIGTFTNSVPVQQTLTEHWNGTSWTIVASPNSSPTMDNVVVGLTCTSSSDCWMVGASVSSGNDRTLTEHWDGSSWSIVASPNSSTSDQEILYAVRCNSSTDCLTAGYHVDNASGFSQTLSEHWNGSVWSIVASPNASPDNFIY